jgi:hypothetical protein
MNREYTSAEKTQSYELSDKPFITLISDPYRNREAQEKGGGSDKEKNICGNKM